MDDLSEARIAKGLAGTRFTEIEVHQSVESTQTMLVGQGGPDGRVIVADHQTAGRGRAGRGWTDLPGRMLMFSALLRGIETPALLTLGAGVAVARALEDAGATPSLKWPNDVLLDDKRGASGVSPDKPGVSGASPDRKVCGILGELAPSGDFAVLGIGLNVSHRAGELPDELGATSLLLATGSAPPRSELCVAILRELATVAGSSGWMDEYRQRCHTIGSRVRVDLGDDSFEGLAEEVRDDGALVVDGRAVVAGDVIHVRRGG